MAIADEKTDETTLAYSGQAGLVTRTGRLRLAPGADLSRGMLRRQVLRLVDSARRYEPELLAAHWTKPMTDSLLHFLAELDANTVEDLMLTKLQTQQYWEAVRVGLKFKRLLVADLRVAALGRPEILQALPLKMGVTRNAAQLLNWLCDIGGLMAALRCELEKVADVDWFAAVDAEVERLCEALGNHANREARRAAFTKKRLAARNALALGIDALCVHAGAAFIRNPSVRNLFRKGSGHARKAKAAPSPAQMTSPAPVLSLAAMSSPAPRESEKVS